MSWADRIITRRSPNSPRRLRRVPVARSPNSIRTVARKTFAAMHRAIHAGLVRACHDLSEGGLAVAAAEMAFAGGFGAKIDLQAMPCDDDLDAASRLFSESNTRFLCEVRAENAASIRSGHCRRGACADRPGDRWRPVDDSRR